MGELPTDDPGKADLDEIDAPPHDPRLEGAVLASGVFVLSLLAAGVVFLLVPVVAGTVYGSVGGIIKATQWTGQTKGLTAAMFIGPPVAMGLQTATAPKEALQAYESYRGIACSSKYYDMHEEGPEFDFSVSPGGGSFSIKF